MKTTKFFAVTNNNGLVAQELQATTKPEAITELKAAVSDRSAQSWLDDNQTALEDACGVSCDGLSYDAALELCASAGAEFVWGSPVGDSKSADSWTIWSHTDLGVRIFRGDETRQISYEGEKADPEKWYYEPSDYEGGTLWSIGYGSRSEAYQAAGCAVVD